MKILLAAVLAIGAFPVLTGFSEPDRYAAGQIWEYRTRPSDTGSLLKVQSVENHDVLGTVYHISVIGIRFRNPEMHPELPHTPVSLETLDASVTRLSTKAPVFPKPEDGIAQWRDDDGGVFTIPVSDIVEIVDRQSSGSF
jgi:hypothetical protein